MSVHDLQVSEVSSAAERSAFIKFPWSLYKNDPYWVAPLLGDRKKMFDPRHNPTFEHMEVALFVARGRWEPAMGVARTRLPTLRDGRQLLGTVAAIINRRHNEFHEEMVGFFGFFESVDESAVAGALLDAAGSWVKARGMTAIRGPMNFTTNDECGLLVDGFDSSPVVLMTYNPRYYVSLVEQAGFSKAMDLLAYQMDFGAARSMESLPSKLARVAEKVRTRGEITVRSINMKDFDAEVERFKHVYNQAWEKNWGFVPMTDAEIDHLAKLLKQVVDPVLVWIAEVAEGPDKGKTVGIGLTIPDANVVLKHMGGKINPITILKMLWYQRQIHMVRVALLGVVEAYRGRGVDALLYYETARSGLEHGYERGEMSWILESNVMMNRAIRMLGGTVYKTYRVYEKPL